MLSNLRIQKNELKELQSLFQKIDIDKDGVLSKEEMREGLPKLSSYALLENNDPKSENQEDICDYIFRTYDTDGDGTISY